MALLGIGILSQVPGIVLSDAPEPASPQLDSSQQLPENELPAACIQIAEKGFFFVRRAMELNQLTGRQLDYLESIDTSYFQWGQGIMEMIQKFSLRSNAQQLIKDLDGLRNLYMGMAIAYRGAFKSCISVHLETKLELLQMETALLQRERDSLKARLDCLNSANVQTGKFIESTDKLTACKTELLKGSEAYASRSEELLQCIRDLTACIKR